MYKLKRIDIGTVALYSFIMLLILSLLFILPFGILVIIINKFIPSSGQPEPNLFNMFGGLFIIIMPIFYAVFGTIMNVLIALCYNLLSLKFGGIKFEVIKLGQLEEMS